MRLLVLGAGLQGCACASDLLRDPRVTEVRLADLRVDRLPRFLASHAGARLIPTPVDARDAEGVRALMGGCDAIMSALPYYLNAEMASHAVDVGVHFCDLGGNTDVVLRQEALDARAKQQGATVVPDCGLAPGLVNIVAEMGIKAIDRVSSVRIYVGGLPRHPVPPLRYQVVYSLEGVLDYYTTLSWVLRDGERVQVPALSEVEPVVFPPPIGELEAFHTAGGLSTMAFRYEGRIPSMEYKTLRYPGHARIMESIRALGLLDLEAVTVKGAKVVPRDAFIAVVGPRLARDAGPDLVAARVEVEGQSRGAPARRAWELVDYADESLGVSAMMRTTGFSLAIVGLMLARGEIPGPGVRTAGECIPGPAYLAELARRGVIVREV